MAKITIDGKEYDTDSLSDEAKQQLQMLQFSEQEIARLQVQLALAQTARIAYGNALKSELEKGKQAFNDDTIHFPE